MTGTESWFATRTMSAIELLAFGPRSAPQVAQGLKVHPRTARRLLNRLVADGYLTRSEGERRVYAPTMRIVALAGQIVESCELSNAAQPYVERLYADTGASAHLVVASYRSALCLVHRSAEPNVRPHLRELVPCHCTAGGRVLLAHRERWCESVLERPLERHTERTVTEPALLRRELAKVRERGFAIEDREFQPDVRSVAAPVFDRSGEAVAALALSAPVALLAPETLLIRARAVRESAAQLSSQLGHVDAAAVGRG